MKTKKLSLGALIVLLAVCLMSVTLLMFTDEMVTSVARAEDVTTNVNYDDYTDSDTLLNSTSTIQEYPDALHHSTASISNLKLTVTDDDPIVKIVPKELFKEAGEYLHIGKEYGFFVKTEAESTYGAYNRKSQVLIFDIITVLNDKDNADIISVQVKPLFQYAYSYIDYRGIKFTSEDGDVINYSIPTDTAYVVAKPTRALPLSYSQSWKYYLKDIYISSTLANEQAPNALNDGYDAFKDNGYFFTQFDYKYSGFTSPVSQSGGYELTLDDVSLIFSVLSLVPVDGVSTAFGLLSLFFTLLSKGEEMQSVADGSGKSGAAVSNGEITATNLYSTKEDQLANYTADGAACLIKNAICGIHGNDKSNNVWFGKNDHATAYYKVSHTEKLHTRLAREIGITVVDSSGKEYNKNTTSEYNYFINESQYGNIDLDDNTKLYLLPDGNNYFVFVPSYTSDYKFTLSNNETADIYVTANNSPVTANEDGKTYRMNGGVMYKIRIHSATAKQPNVNISPSSTANDITANGEYLVKYTPTSAGANNLAVNNQAFIIKKAYENRGGYTYSDMFGVDRALNCANFETVLKQNGIYYLLLRNTSNATASCEINATKCNASLRIGNNASRNITGGKNYVYYEFSFSNENNERRNISFSFEGVENTSIKANFYVFDKDGNPVTDIDQYYEGFLRITNALPGKYYIGVRSAETVALSCRVTDEEITNKWKELINGEWQDVQLNVDKETVIYRGETHYYSYWLGGTQVHDYLLQFDKSQNKDSNIDFTNDDYKLITDNLIIDNEVISLFGKAYSETHNEGMLFQNALKIRILFNKNEVQPTFSVNYDNTIKPTLQLNKGNFIRVNYVLKSNVNNSDGMSTIETSIIDKLHPFNNDIFDTLCDRKATKASIIITNVTFDSKLNDTHSRSETLNLEYRINCYNKLYKPQEMASYVSNELHFYNIRHNPDNIKYLANDITLRHFANWEVIPYNTPSKTIDGNGHTVYGMRFSVPTGSQKLYGFIGENQGTIKNLNFSGVSITGKSSDKYGEMRFGTVAATNYGKIYYCNVSGKIDVYRKDGVVGGIVAINNKSALVQDCVFGYEGSQSTNYLGNSGDIGGIVGRNMGGIQFCRTLNTTIGGDVDHCESSYGGIAGYTDGGVIVSSGASGVKIKVTNGSLISGYYPKMGYVVGHLANSAFMDRCTVSGCGNDIKKLTVGYRKYCFKGPSGSYGRCDNSKVTNM